MTALPHFSIVYQPTLEDILKVVGEPQGFEGEPDEFSEDQVEQMHLALTEGDERILLNAEKIVRDVEF